MTLIHVSKFENPVINILNIISSVWIGFFIYLVIASLIGWIIIGFGKLIPCNLNKIWVLLFLFLFAVMYSFYGLLNATRINLKRITIEIKDLPSQWKDKIIIQLSDLHLRLINNTKFLKRIIPVIDKLDPDLVLITGDLFDGTNRSTAKYIPWLKKIKSKSDIFFVTGNHEGYLGLKEPLMTIKETRIRILDNEIIEINGLQLVGISFPEYNHSSDIEYLFALGSTYDKAKPSILIFHTPTNIIKLNNNRGEQQFNTYWAPDITMDFVKKVGIDLQLSGHTHQGQLWPFGYITRLIFGKYHYGLHIEGDFNIYTTKWYRYMGAANAYCFTVRDCCYNFEIICNTVLP